MTASGSARVELPDGSHVEVPTSPSVGDVLRAWRPNDAGRYLAALRDGVPVDLDREVGGSSRVAPLSFEDPNGREIVQHSAAHVVAKAVVATIPEARPTVGPPTDDGFYYDFDVRPITEGDGARIRERIAAIVAGNEPFRRQELDRDAAERLVAAHPAKLPYIADTPEGEPISVYATGEFVDRCRGPHVPHAGWLAGVHVLGISAVTQGGSADGLPLQRVRGIAFPSKSALEAFLKVRAEAEARDHPVVGQRLDPFSFRAAAPRLPFWHPARADLLPQPP